MGLIRMALAGAAGYAFYKYALKDGSNANAAYDRNEEAAGEGFSQVRNAGPEAMRDKPKNWSELDEAGDESFPASDPATKY